MIKHAQPDGHERTLHAFKRNLTGKNEALIK